jgi:hypothetical protein
MRRLRLVCEDRTVSIVVAKGWLNLYEEYGDEFDIPTLMNK